jgi:hypothetical protein
MLRDMLATRLAAIAGLQVVANSRLVELAGVAGDTGGTALNDAARRAGASEVLEGEVAFGDDGVTLTLRGVTLGSGVVRRGIIMHAASRNALVDSAMLAIARDFGLSAPAENTTALRTRSAEAYAL